MVRNPHCSICSKEGHYKSFHNSFKEKTCLKCKRKLPMSYFWFTKRINKNGKEISPSCNNICKDCNKIVMSERYNKNPRCRLVFLLGTTKRRCVKKQIPFEIDIDYLLSIYNQQKGLCYYTKQPMEYKTIGRNSISIDRKQPKLGYVKGNIALSKWIINNMKLELNEEEFIELCGIIAKK